MNSNFSSLFQSRVFMIECCIFSSKKASWLLYTTSIYNLQNLFTHIKQKCVKISHMCTSNANTFANTTLKTNTNACLRLSKVGLSFSQTNQRLHQFPSLRRFQVSHFRVAFERVEGDRKELVDENLKEVAMVASLEQTVHGVVPHCVHELR